ncbi:hypothetical protein CRG98_045526 [Punica granatum]|uniref:Uncharacterized protein n=1 Tax=Punica granatum TaxID=22663 RepID=A0A2I0HQS2_PUNGR|nr:hypothetical protein CRG98_045526 [Punica granatum]
MEESGRTGDEETEGKRLRGEGWQNRKRGEGRGAGAGVRVYWRRTIESVSRTYLYIIKVEGPLRPKGKKKKKKNLIPVLSGFKETSCDLQNTVDYKHILRNSVPTAMLTYKTFASINQSYVVCLW